MDRAGLREALRQRWPWVADPDVGPSSVEAGECDRCGAEPRLVETCGPAPHRYLGRRCATYDDWCDGHRDDAAAALAWLAERTDEDDEVARLWWLATGEVRLPPGAGLPRLPG